MRPMLAPVVIFLGVFAMVHLASAHLDAGQDTVINGYLIDFGYSPAHPNTINNTFINFNVLDNATQKKINITSMWIRISDTKKTVFSGTFKPENGNVAFQYTFPRKGNYVILSRSYTENGLMVETSESMVVEDSSLLMPILFLLVIIALVMVLLKIIYFYKSTSTDRKKK
jgi:hypothetical protein